MIIKSPAVVNPYVETSCVTGIGVAELFRTLAGAALQATRPEPE
jgi:transcriptional regulatory protein LevR